MTNDKFHLWCIIKGVPGPFRLALNGELIIDDVKNLIWELEKNAMAKNAAAFEITIWKLNQPELINPETTLAERIANLGDLPDFATRLSCTDNVLDIFSEQPLATKSVHIIAVFPSVVTTGKRPHSSPHPEEPSLKQHRANYFYRFPNKAPSTLGQPSEFSKIQKDSAIQIFCNRPRTATSTPITLLHPVFGQFVDDCKDCLITPQLARFAFELAIEMCRFYTNETDRAQVFRNLVCDRLGIKLNAAKVEGTEFTTDGHASIGFHVYVNAECKCEIGSTVADPYLRSAIYYHHRTRHSVGKVQNSRFPCLHIYCFGSCIGFAGSTFSDRVHYEPLTTLVPLSHSPHDTEMFDTITRYLGAFKKAASTLETYYKELPGQTTTTLATDEARFPYPTAFTHLQTQVSAPLKLIEQPLPEKLLFVGLTDDLLVVVKFVRSYSKELHEHCAGLGHAPPLLGFEKLPGDWFMVVMEYMRDHEVYSTLKKHASISTPLRKMVRDLVTSFHAQNLVHGDMRDGNLLVHVDSENGRLDMKLIDFDWGGREGEVRYPALINNFTVFRPLDVIGGQLITARHDLQMVENIF